MFDLKFDVVLAHHGKCPGLQCVPTAPCAPEIMHAVREVLVQKLGDMSGCALTSSTLAVLKAIVNDYVHQWVQYQRVKYYPEFNEWIPTRMNRTECWNLLQAIDRGDITLASAQEMYLPIGTTLNDIRYKLLVAPLSAHNGAATAITFRDRLVQEQQMLLSRMVEIEDELKQLGY